MLTTIRCVEHFQGGPITRNNRVNTEIEPEPWIEINSADARAYGIVDGQKVRVVTARGDSNAAGTLRLPAPPTWTAPNAAVFGGKNFTARVGVGLSKNQRVAQGVVAIPWHWGDKGLSTGAGPTTCASMRWMRTRRYPSTRPVSAESNRCKEV